MNGKPIYGKVPSSTKTRPEISTCGPKSSRKKTRSELGKVIGNYGDIGIYQTQMGVAATDKNRLVWWVRWEKTSQWAESQVSRVFLSMHRFYIRCMSLLKRGGGSDEVHGKSQGFPATVAGTGDPWNLTRDQSKTSLMPQPWHRFVTSLCDWNDWNILNHKNTYRIIRCHKYIVRTIIIILCCIRSRPIIF